MKKKWPYRAFFVIYIYYGISIYATCNSPDGVSGELSDLKGGPLFVCPGESYTYTVDFISASGIESDVDTTTITVEATAADGDTIDVSLSYGTCSLTEEVTVSDGRPGNIGEVGMAVAHPIEFGTISDLNDEAIAWAADNEAVLGGGLVGGCADAARHAYFSARATQELDEESAKQWGDAHEYSNFISCRSNNMDLTNNENGRELGAEDPDATPAETAELVAEALSSGGLFVDGQVGDCTVRADLLSDPPPVP